MKWLAWALYNLGTIAACVFISISAWWMLLALLFLSNAGVIKKESGDTDGSDE